MMKIVKLTKIAGLLAVAISTSACVSSNKASQNAIEAPRPFILAEPVSQKLDLPYEQVAQLNISQAGAAQLLSVSQPVVPLVSRNAPVIDGLLVQSSTASYNVTNVFVDVPTALTVSEANSYVPKADIVWREDPLGDRRAQVKNILENAIMTGASRIPGNRDVVLSARLKMFHAITQKARYTVGGRHNIQFEYVLLDAVTGQPVSGLRSIDVKLKAFGGRKAFKAEMRGDTQKVRITRHVANLVYEQLTTSGAL